MLHSLIGLSATALRELEWLGATLLFALVAQRLILFLAQRLSMRRTWGRMLSDCQKRLKRSVLAVVWMLSLKASLPWVELYPVRSGRLDTVLSVLFILAGTWFVVELVSLLKLIVFGQLDIAGPNNLKQRKVRTQLQFLERVATIFICTVSVALILMNFEGVRKIGSSLIASAGLAGVVLGFAAQRSLGNLLAGFQIAFTQPIRIDDVVIVEGEWGRIEEITLTYVVIRIWDKRTMIVPITYFIEKPFQNWTRSSADLLGVVFLYLDYRIPLDAVRAEFSLILKRPAAARLWAGKVEVVQVTDTTDKCLQVRFLVDARNSSDAFDLRCIVREELVSFIQRRFPEAMPHFRLASFEALPRTEFSSDKFSSAS